MIGERVKEVESSCGSCSKCQIGCPTGALVSDYTLDARRCISYLTIDKRGVLEEWEREAIGEWIFGCDICQEVCPFNHTTMKIGRRVALSEFSPEEGAGKELLLSEILSIRSDEEFVQRFGGTPLMRTKREGLLRNAAVVAGNTRSVATVVALKEACNDKSEVVREHAEWALGKI